MMNTLIRIEEAGMLIASFFLSLEIGFDWWMFFLFLFTPDLSMLGYVFGNKTGSLIYNAIHFKLLGITLGVMGFLLSIPGLTFAGLILFGHSSLDRVFGYGLKYPDDFKHTHFGMLQNKTNKKND